MFSSKIKSDMFVINVVFIIIAILVVVIGIVSCYQWETFKTEHGCVKVSETSGSTTNGIIVGQQTSVMSMYTFGKSTYKCDDGVYYTK